MNIMAPFNPAPVFRSLTDHWPLIVQMTKRDVIGRYRGSLMGLLWSFFHPVLMLAVYTFVFSVVFQARWGGATGGGKVEFAVFLFAGIIVHSLFAESVNKAPGLVVGHANFVKKVVFPLEALSWIAMGSALFHAAVSVIVLLLFASAVNAAWPAWTVLLLPLVMAPLVLLTLGLSWFLSSLGVFLRDVGQMTGIVVMVLMFLSPVFYPSSAIPEPYRALLYLNPLTFAIEQVRDVLVVGRMPHWGGLGLFAAVGVLVASLGMFWFQRTKKGFADVL